MNSLLSVYLLCSLFAAAVCSQLVSGQGATEVRNGGDAVVCRDFDGRILSAELLDFYEGRFVHYPSITTNLGTNDLSVAEKVEVALARFERLTPFRKIEHMAVRRSLEVFNDRSVFVDGELDDVDDAFPQATKEPYFLSTNCKIEQVAIHTRNMVTRESTFYLSQTIWDAMDRDSRAGVILHEVFYLMFIQYGHTYSNQLRLFTAYLASDHLDAMSPFEFEELLHRLGLSDLFKFENNSSRQK